MLVLETLGGKSVTASLLQKRFSDQVFYVTIADAHITGQSLPIHYLISIWTTCR